MSDTRPYLHITDRAVGRIVARAVRTVPGCIRHSSGIDKVTGRQLPRWEVDLDPDNTAMSIEVHVAVCWPSPLTAIAALVRDRVKQWVVAYTGIPVLRVDVVVAAVVPGPVGQPRLSLAPDQLELGPAPTPAGAVARPVVPSVEVAGPAGCREVLPVVAHPVVPWAAPMAHPTPVVHLRGIEEIAPRLQPVVAYPVRPSKPVEVRGE